MLEGGLPSILANRVGFLKNLSLQPPLSQRQCLRLDFEAYKENAFLLFCFGLFFFNSFGLGLFEKGDAVIMPPSFNENFTDSCHMAQASPGTRLCSWEAGLIFFLYGSPTHGQGFSTLRSEAVEASEQTSLPPLK